MKTKPDVPIPAVRKSKRERRMLHNLFCFKANTFTSTHKNIMIILHEKLTTEKDTNTEATGNMECQTCLVCFS